MKKLSTVEEFDQLAEEHDHFLVLKHSSTCPISHAAYEEYENFTKENTNIPSYFLVVQESRPLSNYIADKYGIKHKSPQAFLFSNKDVVWNKSHWNITKKSLTEAVETK